MRALAYTLLAAFILGYTYTAWHDFIYGGDFKQVIIEMMVGAV